jgi:hypothetical protein
MCHSIQLLISVGMFALMGTCSGLTTSGGGMRRAQTNLVTALVLCHWNRGERNSEMLGQERQEIGSSRQAVVERFLQLSQITHTLQHLFC